MKNVIFSILLGSMLVVLSACGGDKQAESSSADTAKGSVESVAKEPASSAEMTIKTEASTHSTEAGTKAETTAESPSEEGADDVLKAGEEIVTKQCSSCHQSEMYTRADHKVKSPEELLSRVKACDANLGTALFDEDIIAVAKYLDKAFYKFSN